MNGLREKSPDGGPTGYCVGTRGFPTGKTPLVKSIGTEPEGGGDVVGGVVVGGGGVGSGVNEPGGGVGSGVNEPGGGSGSNGGKDGGGGRKKPDEGVYSGSKNRVKSAI